MPWMEVPQVDIRHALDDSGTQVEIWHSLDDSRTQVNILHPWMIGRFLNLTYGMPWMVDP